MARPPLKGIRKVVSSPTLLAFKTPGQFILDRALTKEKKPLREKARSIFRALSRSRKGRGEKEDINSSRQTERPENEAVKEESLREEEEEQSQENVEDQQEGTYRRRSING